MSPTVKPAVTFWQVADAKQKVSCICSLVHRFFHRAHRQLITVPNAQAAEYLDKLLWRYPKEAFIPHAVATEPLAAAIVITTAKANLNCAPIVINLCSEVSLLHDHVSEIHELLDITDASKEQLSRQRKQAYEAEGRAVAVNAWSC